MKLIKRKKGGKRDYLARLIIGGKGQGKSSYLNAVSDEYLDKFGKAYAKAGIHPRVFIHDFSESRAFRDIPTVQEVIAKGGLKFDHPLDLLAAKDKKGQPVLKKGKIRYVCRRLADIQHMYLMLANHYRNGMLICDEWTVYVRSNPPDWQVEIVNNHRNYGIELFLVCHQLLKVPPFFVRGDMMSEIVLFKTGEKNITYKQIASKYSCADELWEAYSKLKRTKETDFIIQPYEVIKV